MTTHTALIMATIAGSSAAALGQELIRVSYSWLEVQAGTTIAVAAPNSVVDVGEGARISFHIQALINGTNAVGQTITYTPPPPPGFGTVRGIASAIYNVVGDNRAPTAAGTWGPRSITGVFSPPIFVGNPLFNGAVLDSVGSGQFIAPGGSANSTNPINNAFRGVWTPVSYLPRTVHFICEPGTAAPTGQHNGILVAFGITQPDPGDPTTWYDNLLTKYISTDFGAGISIPIAPSPASALILAFTPLLTPRRRRNSPVSSRPTPV